MSCSKSLSREKESAAAGDGGGGGGGGGGVRTGTKNIRSPPVYRGDLINVSPRIKQDTRFIWQEQMMSFRRL